MYTHIHTICVYIYIYIYISTHILPYKTLAGQPACLPARQPGGLGPACSFHGGFQKAPDSHVSNVMNVVREVM